MIIDFNNINNKFKYGSKLIIEVYNNENNLIDEYSLYVKMFSNMKVFSSKKPQTVINNYLCLIYVDIKTNIALLIEEGDNFCALYIGFYKNRIFKELINYIYINKQMVLEYIKNDLTLIRENVSIDVCLNLLEKINDKYLSIHLLKKI